MTNTSVFSFADSIKWNWLDMCETGIEPWSNNSNELAQCFQQICLQFPTYILLAVTSAYYFGKNWNDIIRDKKQLIALHLRIFITIALAVIPVTKVYFLVRDTVKVWPIDILLVCTESLTWSVHAAYLVSIKKSGQRSHRGPLTLIVIWSAILMMSLIWAHSSLRTPSEFWSILVFSLNITYGLTLLPKGQARVIKRTSANDERSALLGNAYIRFQEAMDIMILGPAQDAAPFLSKIIFYWVNPLITKGVRGHLFRNDDLFDLPECLNVTRISEKLQKAINETTSLLRSLHRCFGVEFYLIGILRLIADMSSFAGPILLGGLLSNASSDEEIKADTKSYLYAAGLMLSTLISALAGTHFSWRMSIISLKMRTGLVTAIYQKALTARGLQDASPDILNLMSTDTDRIVNSCISFHSFWSIPFQLFTTLYLLYTQLGMAFIAGVVFAAALIPLNRWIAIQIGRLSQGLMSAKDGRVSKSSESLAGIKQIKLHAWEDLFINKIEDLRKDEIKFLSKRKYLDALCVYFWATTPVLICLLTFGVSVLNGNALTAASTYTSVALLNMLIGPLNAFPWVLNGLTEAWVSLKRVQQLFDIRNIDLTTYYTPMAKEYQTDFNQPNVITLKNVSFENFNSRFTNDSALDEQQIRDFKLDNINLEVKKGDLVCISGKVGSGKSSLLSGIIANLTSRYGEIAVDGIENGFGYVSQSPWLQRGTIRDNILWGAIYDESRYKNIIRACALIPDLEILGGDRTGVGESGRTLSGGQKARVVLARALYQNKEIYLLDDILSALDAHVATHIVRHCIFGLLAKKTRIIITENKTVLHNATQVWQVDNGNVSVVDTENADFVPDDNYSDDHDFEPESISSITLFEDDCKSVDSTMLEESKEYGTLDTKVLSYYWSAMGGTVAAFVILSVVLMQTSRNLTDAWLANWVSQYNTNGTNVTHALSFIRDINATESVDTMSGVSGFFSRLRDLFDSIFHHEEQLEVLTDADSADDPSDNVNYYLGVYAGLALTNSFITLIRAFLFAYAGIQAAKCIHDKLLKSVFFTKLQFFDVTPLGRILNRFSSDVYTIDDSLPFILNIFLAQLFGLLGALIICLYAMPWLGLVVVPLCPIYLSLQQKYRYSSRDIKRLSSNALSPLYVHFTETLQGLTTIRSMRASERFKKDFGVKLEESLRAQLSSSAAQQWLGLRLQFLGVAIVGGAGFLAAITSAHMRNPELVGLAISYALSITSLLAGVLNAVAETEQELIAIERVAQYSDLDKEPNAEGSIDPTYGWPCQGVIHFNNVIMSYREHLQPALKGINFKTDSCEHLGIVGRTGAGKTSILSALLRVSPLTRGTILIDHVNIATLSLEAVRSRLAIIPQEPFLFAGTVRENLDPYSLHVDSKIWQAINNCLASPLIQSLGGLSAKLETGGTNLSAGQKQLLCLTRALLKNSKIILVDEGTANLDSDSEASIQLVLKNAFRSSTVIIIAHRLNGLQNTDRIIVMNEGKIIETGTPTELAHDEVSYFRQMLNEQNNKTFYY